MNNAFASAVIVLNFSFDDLPNVQPQMPYTSLSVSDFIPSSNDIRLIKEEFVIHMSVSCAKLLPYFQKFAKKIPKFLSVPHEFMGNINKVISLPLLLKNEQKLSDVVLILDYYVNFLDKCYKEAGRCFDNVQVHIGGDQLTRERFSGGKRIRTDHGDPKTNFSNLGPITFELFHMVMNFLQLIFKELYKSSSVAECGTLKFIQDRLSRKSVNEDVKKAYDADKEFIIAVNDIYSVVSIMQHFGMSAYTDQPTKNMCPCDCSEQDEYEWFVKEMRSIVNTICLNTDYLNDSTDVQGMIADIHCMI
jgi:hypothetical protein